MLGFQIDSKFGSLKQWHINETTNRLLCFAVCYLNKRNSVALGMDRFSLNPSSFRLPMGPGWFIILRLKLCSFYLYLATGIVHQGVFQKFLSCVCSKTLIPLVLTHPLTSAPLRLWSWDRPRKHVLLQKTAVLKTPMRTKVPWPCPVVEPGPKGLWKHSAHLTNHMQLLGFSSFSS